VHLDYQRAGLIDDPFFGINHDKLRWMEEMEWWFRSDLTPPAIESGKRLHLLFEGLDCFATVYLNGKEIGRNSNQFTPLRLDATDYVVAGANRLEVRLGAPLFQEGRTYTPEVRGYGQITRLHVRKSQSCYGWNISPRMGTIGIWKPVSFLIVEGAELADIFVSTVAVNDGTADLEALVELRHNHGQPGTVACELTGAGQTRKVS